MARTYVVLDNGRPAKYPDIAVKENAGWDNNAFKTFEEARDYAFHWLNFEAPLKLNEPYDYSGYGDTVLITYHGREDMP